MGRCSIDLAKLEHEHTHKLWVEVEEGEGKLHLLLTISGKSNSEEPIMDLEKWSDPPEILEQRIQSFRLRNSFNVSMML